MKMSMFISISYEEPMAALVCDCLHKSATFNSANPYFLAWLCWRIFNFKNTAIFICPFTYRFVGIDLPFRTLHHSLTSPPLPHTPSTPRKLSSFSWSVNKS